MRHSSAPTTRADTGEMMEVQSDDNASWASLTDEPLAMTPDASQDTLSQEQARCESAMVTENPDGELNTPTESRNDNGK